MHGWRGHLQFASDGWCADGGVGAYSSECPFGSDCSDCGANRSLSAVAAQPRLHLGIDEGFFLRSSDQKRCLRCTHVYRARTRSRCRRRCHHSVHTKAGLAPWRRASRMHVVANPDSPPPSPPPCGQPPSCNNDCLEFTSDGVCDDGGREPSSPTVCWAATATIVASGLPRARLLCCHRRRPGRWLRRAPLLNR